MDSHRHPPRQTAPLNGFDMIGMILFNALLVAALACLIKPQLLDRYTGGRTPPRWVFLIALLVLGAVSPYGGGSPQPGEAHTSMAECNGVTTSACASTEEVPAAAAASAPLEEEAAPLR